MHRDNAAEGRPSMRYLLIGAAAAAAVITGPVRAQAQPPGTYQAQLPQAAYPNRHPLLALQCPDGGGCLSRGLINRWQYEQIDGPLPQALQGPSPNGKSEATGGF